MLGYANLFPCAPARARRHLTSATRQRRRRAWRVECLEERLVLSAAVATDLLDYSPGSMAAISGTGFQADETVTLQVTHTDGSLALGNGTDPWTVTTDDSGNFSTSWYVNPIDSVNQAFMLTATGNQGDAASSSFTDSAPLSGSIYTSNFDCSVVNANIYALNTDVYLNGGPDSGGHNLPDGYYYFQVTDPNGAVLLSTDPVANREVHISNGLIDQYIGDGSDPPHVTGTCITTGGTTVQLMPFNVTPNNGGEYKLWITPIGEFDVANASDPKSNFGFDGATKTDNFKIAAATGTIVVTKNAVGANGATTSFSFTDNYVPGGNFSLFGGGSNSSANLAAGNYTITEGSEPAHWAYGNVVWGTTPGGSDLGSSNTTSANVNLPSGGTVYVTFTDNRVQNTVSFNTTASASPNLVVGSALISDTATLSGQSSDAGGTVTFDLYGPNDPGHTSSLDHEVFNVTGSTHTFTTANTVLATQVGKYQWVANYSGDLNNTPGSDSDSSESVTIIAASPTLVTTASPAVTLGITTTTITDMADLEGAFSPTGSIVFTLTLNGNPVPAATQTDTVTHNGLYSASYTLPTTGNVTGTYLWHAVYTSGDGNNNNTNDTLSSASKESTVVSPASPTLITTASQAVTLGTGMTTITDSADLEGAYFPTGSITFTLTLNGNPVPAATQTDTVTGNGTYGASFTLPTAGTVAGTYLWHAVYTSGDGNNMAADDTQSPNSQESTIVSPASPTLVTTASQAVTLGTGMTTITDSADLEGAYFPTGSITFTLTLNGNPVPAATQTDTVNGNGAYGASYTLPTTGTVAGTYLWHAVFTSGDGNNMAADDTQSPISQESTIVSPASPTLVTTASQAVTLGTTTTTITDSADLEGAYFPTGSITFTLTLNGNPVPAATQTDTVTGNGAYGASYTLPTTGTVAGTYLWHAVYTSGDGNNMAADDTQSPNSQESTIVSPASPTLATTASSAVTLGTGMTTITDSADLEGAYFPTGSITFTLTLNGNPVPAATQTDTVTGNGTYGASFTLPTTGTVAGTYLWHAVYTSGDGNNMAADDTQSANSHESTIVSPASPTLVTTASHAVTLGTTTTTITDSADLEGAYFPTGSITFTLTLNGNPVPAATQTDIVTHNGVYGASYTLPTTGTVTGTYLWHAVFTSGDGNNKAADDTQSSNSHESTIVSPASPSLMTTASQTTNTGTTAPTIKDSAVLSGGYFPKGQLTFTLYLVTGSGNTLVYTTNVNVNGNGTYTASTANESSVGLYQWVVTYNGDGNNIIVHDQGGAAEQVLIQDQVVNGEAATLGFWSNKNGQALLKTYSASIGSWLSSTYSNLFGNLSGANGTQVANYFLNYVKPNASGSTYNTYAQALTTALNVWVTTTGLGWNSTAASYGFHQGFGGLGLGDIFFNVGTNGASFGVANNTLMTVSSLLSYFNSQTVRTGSSFTALPTFVFYVNNNTSLLNGANNVFNGINNAGDII